MVFKQRGFDTQAIIGFENDVKIYGIQTQQMLSILSLVFENDVKIYGI